MPGELISVIQEPGKYRFVEANSGGLIIPGEAPISDSDLMGYLAEEVRFDLHRVHSDMGFDTVSSIFKPGIHHVRVKGSNYLITSKFTSLSTYCSSSLRMKHIRAIVDSGRSFRIVNDSKTTHSVFEMTLRKGLYSWSGYIKLDEQDPGRLEIKSIKWLNAMARQHGFRFRPETESIA